MSVFASAQDREEAAKWPEHRQRVREWFSLKDAVAAVDESGLKKIVAGCCGDHRILAYEPRFPRDR